MTRASIPPDDNDPIHPAQALVLSLIMPWRACQGAWRQTTAFKSLIYHFTGLAIFLIGLIFIDSAFWYGDLFSEFNSIDADEVPLVFLFIGVYLLLIELGYLFTAWWTSCWGSTVEPMRLNVRRSLARWYQLTPFHASWTLGLFVAIEIVENLQWSMDYDYGSMSYEFMEFIYSSMYLAVFLVYAGVGGWFTLRALAVPRNSEVYRPKSRWPALCETCGYAIVGLAYDQSCPECGRTVQSSLKTPRGTPQFNTLAKMRMALFNPTAIGQVLLTRTRTKSPALALTITALCLLCTGPVGLLYIFITTSIIADSWWIDGPFEFMQFFFVAGLATGLSAMVGGVSIILGIGSLIGLAERVFGKRNNLPAACHAACYASGYVLFMAILMYGFTGALIIFADRYLGHLGFGLIAVLPLTWLTVCLALTLPYCFIVGRIVRGTKYANA